jgi:hypothetical protein
MEHSGATSWSLKDAADDAANRAVSWGGHANPKDENRDTTCRKSTPMPSALRFTPFQRAIPRRASTAAVRASTCGEGRVKQRTAQRAST